MCSVERTGCTEAQGRERSVFGGCGGKEGEERAVEINIGCTEKGQVSYIREVKRNSV